MTKIVTKWGRISVVPTEVINCNLICGKLDIDEDNNLYNIFGDFCGRIIL